MRDLLGPPLLLRAPLLYDLLPGDAKMSPRTAVTGREEASQLGSSSVSREAGENSCGGKVLLGDTADTGGVKVSGFGWGHRMAGGDPRSLCGDARYFRGRAHLVDLCCVCRRRESLGGDQDGVLGILCLIPLEAYSTPWLEAAVESCNGVLILLPA